MKVDVIMDYFEWYVDVKIPISPDWRPMLHICWYYSIMGGKTTFVDPVWTTSRVAYSSSGYTWRRRYFRYELGIIINADFDRLEQKWICTDNLTMHDLSMLMYEWLISHTPFTQGEDIHILSLQEYQNILKHYQPNNDILNH